MRLALPLLALLCTSLAIAKPSQMAREEVQLAFSHDGDRDSLKPVGEVLRLAQRLRPGLIVTLRTFPESSYYRQVQQWTRPGATNVPDLVILRDQWLPEFSSVLLPLNPVLPARDLARIPESIKSRLRFAGSLYGVPWGLEGQALYYRPDLLTAAGVLPPRTWEELLIAARRCHQPPSVCGFGLPGIRDSGAARLLLQLLWAYGTDLPPVGDSGRLNTTSLIAALSIYAGLHEVAEPEVLSWDDLALEDHFAAGRLAMILASRSFSDHLRESSSTVKWAVAPTPTGNVSAGFLDLEIACVLKGSSHAEAAVCVLRALTTAEACEGLMKHGSLPYRSDLATARRLDPTIGPFVAALDCARGLPPQRWASAQPVLSDALFYLLTGRRTVEEATEMVVDGFTRGQTLQPGQ